MPYSSFGTWGPRKSPTTELTRPRCPLNGLRKQRANVFNSKALELQMTNHNLSHVLFSTPSWGDAKCIRGQEQAPVRTAPGPQGAAEADVCLGWQLRRTGRSEGPQPEAGGADAVSLLPLSLKGGLSEAVTTRLLLLPYSSLHPCHSSPTSSAQMFWDLITKSRVLDGITLTSQH